MTEISQADFERSERHLVAIGGRLLEDPHRSDEITGLDEIAYTSGCGGQCRAALPYEREDGRGGFATICVACDRGDLMPALS